MKRYYIAVSKEGEIIHLVMSFDTEDEAGRWYENNLLGSPSIKGCKVSLVDTYDGMYRDYETDKELYFKE